MAKPKSAELSPDLVAVKGKALPDKSRYSAPLNFKVDSDFRRRFRRCAANADLKLNQLLREALDAWEQKNNQKI